MGGDPVDDPLGGVGAIEEVEDDNNNEEDNEDDEDNEYEDEYDAEEEAYLNQFINKDSVVSKGQTGHKWVNFLEFVLIISFFTGTLEEGQTSQIDSRQEKLCRVD